MHLHKNLYARASTELCAILICCAPEMMAVTVHNVCLPVCLGSAFSVFGNGMSLRLLIKWTPCSKGSCLHCYLTCRPVMSCTQSVDANKCSFADLGLLRLACVVPHR